MVDQDRQFIEVAMRYLALLEAGDVVSIPRFVQTVDAPLRDELAPYLEEVLAAGVELDRAVASEDEALAERAAARFGRRVAQHGAAAQLPTLTAARDACEMSTAALARRLNLPLDLWVWIERGLVVPETIPRRLIARLAAVLRQPEAGIARLLGIMDFAPSPPRLREKSERYDSTAAGAPANAETGAHVPPSTMMSFAEALEISDPTPQQRDEWMRAE
jgi:DNA-binding transcriptional regulator YiaG